MKLIKTLKISQKVSLTYTEFVELATTECPLCLEPLHAASIGQPNTCQHMFHYRELEKLAKNKECPICRKPFDFVKQVSLKKP